MAHERDGWPRECEALFVRIGEALKRAGLSPTPQNYESVYASLGAGIADAPAARNAGPIAVGDRKLVENVALRAATAMDSVAAILQRSGEEARHYGDQLEASLATADAGRSAQDALIAATRAMQLRMHRLEEELEAERVQLHSLRTKLAEADRRAETDPLTQLPNRRALDLHLRAALANARDQDQPLSIALCDIDHFRQFNDVHGHSVGDLVLQAVAQSLQEMAGQRSFVARYGGEEFVIVLEGCASQSASERMDAIRTFFSRRRWSVTDTGRELGTVSISVGVAQLRGRESAATLIKRADAALYEAKREGRDRVRLAA